MSNEKYIQAAKDAVAAIYQNGKEKGLTRDQQEQISYLYWNSDATAKSIQDEFGITNIHATIMPLFANRSCPYCSFELVYTSRTRRDKDEITCLGCKHNNYGNCQCDGCKQARQQDWCKEAEEIRIESEFEYLYDLHCTTEYVAQTITKFTRQQKIFLRAFIEVVQNSSNPTWQEICNKAGVISEKPYSEKLQQLKLLWQKPKGGIIYNSAITLEMLSVPSVRSISKSLRFDVFQRDKHTCQYCGRRPP